MYECSQTDMHGMPSNMEACMYAGKPAGKQAWVCMHSGMLAFRNEGMEKYKYASMHGHWSGMDACMGAKNPIL